MGGMFHQTGILVWIGTLLLSGLALVEQVYVWLRYGFWPVRDFSSAFTELGLAAPKTNWHGVQTIIDYLLALPFSVMMFVTGSAAALTLMLFGDHLDNLARERRRKKER